MGCLGALLFAEAGLQVVAFEKEPNVYALPRAVNLDGEIVGLEPLVCRHQRHDAALADERAGFANSKREWLFGGYSIAVGSNGGSPRICLTNQSWNRSCAKKWSSTLTSPQYWLCSYKLH